jgi:hypothetical protein
MSEQGWKEFVAAEGVDDWAVLHGGATAVFRIRSIGQGAEIALALAGIPGGREVDQAQRALAAEQRLSDGFGALAQAEQLARRGRHGNYPEGHVDDQARLDRLPDGRGPAVDAGDELGLGRRTRLRHKRSREGELDVRHPRLLIIRAVDLT